MAIGNVLFWRPISLSCPFKDITQFGPAEIKVPFSLGFLFPGCLIFKSSESRSVIAAYTSRPAFRNFSGQGRFRETRALR